MAKPPPVDLKEQALRDQNAFNTHAVQDELFRASEFFDPRDLVQVKYEMLRKVEQEGVAVSEAAKGFGFSRMSYYQTREAFTGGGIGGLLPRKRGPKRAHKLTDEVLAYVEELRATGERTTTVEVVKRIEERFGVRVHRRSVERATARRRGKKTP